MCGEAYRTSAEIAEAMGPFARYRQNRDSFLQVIEMHRAAAELVPADGVPADLLAAARECWAKALAAGRRHGYKNAQVTVLAPTGTIAFMMDCDTTGVEPDLSLVKYKKLVGGGLLKIVNGTVPMALHRLGYAEDAIQRIVAGSTSTRRSRALRISSSATSRCSTARSGRRTARAASSGWATCA